MNVYGLDIALHTAGLAELAFPDHLGKRLDTLKDGAGRVGHVVGTDASSRKRLAERSRRLQRYLSLLSANVALRKGSDEAWCVTLVLLYRYLMKRQMPSPYMNGSPPP